MEYAPIPLVGKSEMIPFTLHTDRLSFAGMAAHHMHPPDEKRSLKIRLRKIAGQIAAVERMIDEDRDCPEVLTQIVSARKALKSFAQVVIHQHTHQCIEGASDPKEGQRKLRELLTVLERYVD
jgi:DNA-binding FrmR family transcriptional regulator